MALQRLLIREGLISEQRPELVSAIGGQGEQFAVVVADLMPEVPKHRTVWLVHALPQRLAVRVVALRQVKGDDPVLMAGDDLALTTGEQIERQADGTVADHDRELELVESEDQPAFGGLGDPVLPESPTVSASAGRVRVKLQLKHKPSADAGSAIQLHPQRLRLAQIGRSAVTATMVPCSREYPTARAASAHRPSSRRRARLRRLRSETRARWFTVPVEVRTVDRAGRV